jgi:hypothetical protein
MRFSQKNHVLVTPQTECVGKKQQQISNKSKNILKAEMVTHKNSDTQVVTQSLSQWLES